MPFAVEDFHDLVRLLEERPEWRADLRRLVLTTELLAMPEQLATLRAETERAFQRMAEAQARTDEQLAALIEAQKRTDERLDALAQRVEELTEAQKRTDERLDALAQRVEELTEAQKRTDERLDALAQRVEELTETQARMADQLAALSQRVEDLTEQMARLTRTVGVLVDDVGDLKGRSLETDYRTKGHAYFSRLIRRPHVLSSDELVELVEAACDKRILSVDQAREIYDADVIVRGKRLTDGAEIYLIVEVSWGVGPHDVERAVERAELLAQTGALTIPVVAGKKITAPAARMAQAKHVWQVTNGQVTSPEPTPSSS